MLAGHSLGRFLARFYAAIYPDDVAGLVLVDAFSELLEDSISPERWQALVRLNQGMGSDDILTIPGYGEAETTGYGRDNEVVREAVAASPLPPMPLAVRAHGRPFTLPAGQQEFTSDELEGYVRTANEALAALVPNARFWLASESGHDVHQDQPELVVEAIQQVVAGVRAPGTWNDLLSCCAS